MGNKTQAFRRQSFFASPLRAWIFLLVAITAVVVSASLAYFKDDYDGYIRLLLGELHGLIFDVVIIGILVFWLFKKAEKRKSVIDYQEEIDDLRTWKSEEAAFKTVGNIKRLNRLGIYAIDLSHCYLSETNLNHARLQGANLNYAQLSHAFLIDVNFEGARLNQTNFENSNLNQSRFTECYAGGAIFRDAYLIKTDFRGASMIKANLQNAYLMEANLHGADLTEANLSNSNLYKADLRGATGLSVEQLAKAKTLYLTRFDQDIQTAIQNKYPDLIGK